MEPVFHDEKMIIIIEITMCIGVQRAIQII